MYFYKVYIWLRVLCSKAACHRNMKHTQTLINQYTLTNRMHSCSWAFCFRMCVLMIRFNSGWRGLCLCPFMSWFYRLKHLTIYHSHRERAAKDAPRMWLNITVWNLYLTANITTNWAVTELIRLVREKEQVFYCEKHDSSEAHSRSVYINTRNHAINVRKLA